MGGKESIDVHNQGIAVAFTTTMPRFASRG